MITTKRTCIVSWCCYSATKSQLYCFIITDQSSL